MRVRHIIARDKFLETQTAWSEKDMPPKHAPIYLKTKPIRAGWRWRSAKCISLDGNFTLVAECNPGRGNWKAMLLLERDGGHSLIARFEDHGSHPGLHCHSDCDVSGLEVGPKTIDARRIPSANSFHRRSTAWTENRFWDAAKAFFRIRNRPGSLGL